MPVIIEPGNPFDFEDEELQILVGELQSSAGTTVEIYRRTERGYGVTLFEVLHVYLEVAGGLATVWGSSEIVYKVVSFMKDRGRKKRPAVLVN